MFLFVWLRAICFVLFCYLISPLHHFFLSAVHHLFLGLISFHLLLAGTYHRNSTCSSTHRERLLLGSSRSPHIYDFKGRFCRYFCSFLLWIATFEISFALNLLLFYTSQVMPVLTASFWFFSSNSVEGMRCISMLITFCFNIGYA